MAEYEVGDSFIATITNVNDSLYANKFQLTEMEYLEKPTLSEVSSPKEEMKKTYTSEDLLERIARANNILNELIKIYVEVTQTVNHIPDIDNRIEELSL